LITCFGQGLLSTPFFSPFSLPLERASGGTCCFFCTRSLFCNTKPLFLLFGTHPYLSSALFFYSRLPFLLPHTSVEVFRFSPPIRKCCLKFWMGRVVYAACSLPCFFPLLPRGNFPFLLCRSDFLFFFFFGFFSFHRTNTICPLRVQCAPLPCFSPF